MNRFELAALARATVTVFLGFVILCLIGHWLGWIVVGAILGCAVGDTLWTWTRLPARWRLW